MLPGFESGALGGPRWLATTRRRLTRPMSVSQPAASSAKSCSRCEPACPGSRSDRIACDSRRLRSRTTSRRSACRRRRSRAGPGSPLTSAGRHREAAPHRRRALKPDEHPRGRRRACRPAEPRRLAAAVAVNVTSGASRPAAARVALPSAAKKRRPAARARARARSAAAARRRAGAPGRRAGGSCPRSCPASRRSRRSRSRRPRAAGRPRARPATGLQQDQERQRERLRASRAASGRRVVEDRLGQPGARSTARGAPRGAQWSMASRVMTVDS